MKELDELDKIIVYYGHQVLNNYNSKNCLNQTRQQIINWALSKLPKKEGVIEVKTDSVMIKGYTDRVKGFNQAITQTEENIRSER